jgi:alanyl-tRNA synthetase
VTATRAPAEPYTLRFESPLESVSEHADGEGVDVVLDETYFYAESGGQPADKGTIAGIDVLDVQHRDGEVRHTLAEPIAASAGETLTGEIDPDFRTYCMRAHTASHALYGAGRRRLDDLGYGGFDIGEGKVRVDFETTTEIDADLLVDLEALVNRAVWDSHDVSWGQHPSEEALAREDVAFNAKTEEGLGEEAVRLVEIDGWDIAACGGTHVRNTREIGPVTVLDRSNPGEGRTRVEFAVGPAAIERRADEHGATLAAAAAANTQVTDLPDAIARLRDEREDAIAERDALRERLVESRIADLREAIVERDGESWLVGSIEGLDANELADRAGSVVDSAGNDEDGEDREGEDGDDASDGDPAVVALVESDGGYLAVASEGEADAGGVIERVTAEFGGGGGGSPSVAQGGGLDAEPEELVAFLRDERE